MGSGVSVIIPNYNYARTLDLCLRSLKAQTVPPDEVIVVDDGSTDDSVAVAASYGATILSTGGGGGVSVGRNLGAAHASGRIFFFIDSDVALAQDAVAQVLAVLEANPRTGALCGIEDPEPLIRDSRVEEYRSLQYHYWELSSQGVVSFLCPAMVAIPAAVFTEVGPFNPRLRHTEEVDYGQRVTAAGYQVMLTADVHGAHDHDANLRLLLRKMIDRGRHRIPAYLRAKRMAKGFETPARAAGAVAAFASLVALPLIAFGAVWGVLPVALAGVSVICDAGMYRFVVRRRGIVFGAYFTAVQYVVNITIVLGVVIGVAQYLFSKSFRGLYGPLAADPEGAAGS